MVKRIILKSRNLLHRRRNRIIKNFFILFLFLTLAFVFRFPLYTFIINMTHPYPEWVEINSDYIDVALFREALIKKLKENKLVPYGIHSFQGSLHCIEATKSEDSYQLTFRVMMPYGSIIKGPSVYYRITGETPKKLEYEILVERYSQKRAKWKNVDHYITTIKREEEQ